MSKPTDYTPELRDAIAERLCSQSMRSICRDEAMPARSTVHVWLAKHEDFREACRMAWDIQGHDAADEIRDLRERLLAGEIGPDVHREAKDSCKWEAGKRVPKVYGDKLELAGDAAAPLTIVVRKLTDA